jgi:hypothetical protein
MSARSLEQLVKTLIVMAVVVWVSYRAVKRELRVPPW